MLTDLPSAPKHRFCDFTVHFFQTLLPPVGKWQDRRIKNTSHNLINRLRPSHTCVQNTPPMQTLNQVCRCCGPVAVVVDAAEGEVG